MPGPANPPWTEWGRITERPVILAVVAQDATTGGGGSASGFRLEDPRQQEIFARLRRLVGPGPALFYRDACRHLAAEDPMDTVTHQVGHCVREIESALRAVLRNSIATGAAVATPASPPKPTGGQEEKRTDHEKDILAIVAGLGMAEADPIPQAWLALAGGLHGRAHRHALNPPRPLDRDFEQFFGAMEEVLLEILVRFEARFGSSFGLVDELLGKEDPTAKDAARLKQKVPNTLVAHVRFFEGIPDGRWLGPLEEEGFFDSPPGPETDEDGGVSLPPWPQSRYLARVATARPEKVREIVVRLPATDNVRVLEDVAEAALAMPASSAAEIALKVAREGLGSPHYTSNLPRNLSGIVSRLAQAGDANDALELARELLALVPETTVPERVYGDVTVPATVEPRPRFRPPEVYGEAISSCLGPLVDASGPRAVGVLGGLLEDAIRLSTDPYRERGAEGLPYEDGLYLTRPAVEESHRNDDRGPLGEVAVYLLLAAVRDAAERVATADALAVERLVGEFEAKNNETFDRLALHLLRRFPDAPAAPGMIAGRLKGQLAGLTPGLFHEYAVLLRERFGTLSPEDRREILATIGAGPPPAELEMVKERRAADDFGADEPPSKEDLDAYAKGYAERWRLRRCAVLSDLLPRAEHAEYERLASEHPDIVGGDPLFYGEPRVRTIPRRGSPKSAEELRAMPVREAVAFLRGFEPTGDWEGPGVRDVAHELHLAVAAAPSRFAAEAEGFRGLDPSYVRALFWGLRDGLRGEQAVGTNGAGAADADGGEGASTTQPGPSFEWGPVLGLCRWVLDQPRRPSEEQYRGGRDIGWGPSRRWIGELLRDAFRGGEDVPSGLRGMVWGVVRALSEDPEPELSDEQGGTTDRPGSSPRHLAINTVRGVAMHAVVAYALWVRRSTGDESWRGLADAPEAQAVLESRLDPAVELTRAVRSVYGATLPLLVYLDRAWVEAWLPRVFPDDAAHLRDAAWDSYVLDWSPYNDAFEVLRSQYADAVRRLDPGTTLESSRGPDASLAEHLMILLWRGRLAFGEADGILETFYARASDPLRRLAAGFVGRYLRNLKGPVPPEQVARMEDLWERRLASAAEHRETPAGEELGAFAWFFLSGKFDEAAALGRLDRALALGADVDRDAYSVVRALAQAASVHPRLAVACLDKIVRKILGGGRDSLWRIMSIADDAIRVLTVARGADQETRTTATELANILVAHGHSGFEPFARA